MTTTTTLAIGSTVRIRPTNAESAEYHNRVGEFIKINQHNADGDAFGVTFSDDWTVVYFFEHELQQVYMLANALNNEDNAIATATNADGATIEVSYHHNLPGGRPFWIWLEQSEATKPVDRIVAAFDLFNRDVRLSFDFAEMGEDLFGDYDLDVDAAIWARQTQVKQEAQ